jgi:hypothetical protein
MNQHTRLRAPVSRSLPVIAGLLTSLLLIACGGSPEPTPTPTLAPTQPPLPTSPPTTAPSPRIVPSPTPAPVDAGAANTSTAASPAAVANPADCTNQAANVRDANVPDGTTLNRGETFTKTWLIRNAGTCTWNDNYTIVFFAGDRLDGQDGVKLPVTPPGADAEVSVPMRASLRPGTFQGYWKLRAPNGQTFGTGAQSNVAFWVLITVK